MNDEQLNTTDWKTFPERIRIYQNTQPDSLDWGDANCDSDSDEVAYTRHDLYNEAMRQNAALKEFVKNRLPDCAWSLNAPYAAYELGIMVKDIEHHGEEEALKFAPWMLTDAAMPTVKDSLTTQSKAQIAREFLDELYGTGLSAEVLALIMRKVWEWEAAEEKC